MLRLEAFALPALVLLIKATCLLLIALAASLLLQRASAGSRHLVWLVTVVGLLALPVMSAWAPLQLAVLPARPSADASASSGGFLGIDASAGGSRLDIPVSGGIQDGGSRQAGSSGSTPSEPSDAPTATPVAAAAGPSESAAAGALSGSPFRLATLLFGGWILVALALGLWLAYGAWSVRRIVARAEPLDDPDWQTPLYEIADRLGLEAAPRLLRSDDVRMPFAAGVLSSTIVLPAESDGWSAERRTAVLIHELGHVRRRDLIGHTLGRVACALWWFHPLAWTAARRLRAESERACDDLALVFGARPSDYAEHLLDIVSCVRDHHTPAVALAMAHRREFEGRMLAILDPELQRRGMGRLQTTGLVGGLAALALAVGAAAPVPRAAVSASRMPQAGASNTAQAPSDTAVGPDEAVRKPLVALRSRDGRTRVAVADTTSDIGVLVDSNGVQVAVSAKHPGARSSALIRLGGASALARGPAQASAQASARVLSRAARSAIAIATGDTSRSSRRAEALAKMLRSDSSAEVRRIAAWGLNDYGENHAAVEALAAALASDSDASVREMAAWSLSDADGNSNAATALGKALAQDKDAKVRATATWALGQVGEAGAVAALVPMLSDANVETREVAAWSIGSCEPKKAPAALVSLLNDRNRDVRLSVAWALYNIEDPDATDALEAAYKRETDPEVRLGLIRALGAMGDRSVDVLQRLVTSSDPHVRKMAVTELAGGGASGPWPWPRPEPRPFPNDGSDEVSGER
ncbi:MAG: HEAT repeat domain-containing protein [Gemmatimonadales bacterium]